MKTKRYNFFRLKMSKLLVGEHEAQRNVKPCNMGNAKSAGLLFAVNSETDVADAEYVFNHLKDNNISVSALGYIVDSKNAGNFRRPTNFDFYTDKDLDFLFRPKSEAAKKFAGTEFDILIDINSADYYPAKLLLNSTMAHFRIGRFADKRPFDLMMCIADDKDVRYYYEQIIFYLQKFN